MATPKNANCPSCAGDLQIDPNSDRVTCRYCGTVSFIQGRGRPPANAPLIVLKVPTATIAVIAIGVSIALLTVVAVVLATLQPSAPVAAPPIPRLIPVPKPSLPPPPAPVAQLRVLASSPALLVDANADGHGDVVVPVSVSLSGTTTRHFAVYDGQALKELARTVPLTDDTRDLVVATHGRLIVAQHNGQLVAYDLTSGKEQWSTALGERVLELREARSTDFVHVTTDATRMLLVDLTTGRQSETRESGTALLASNEGDDDPRDRHDYQAPNGLEAYHCGGVTVMGSANFSVPDQCRARAHVDTDRLEGMIGHRLWKHGKDWLVFGVRSPGAYVPMVGLVKRGKLAWKSVVPASDPLEAESGGPRHVVLAGSTLTVAYQTGQDRISRITAFDVELGARLFTSELPEHGEEVRSLLTDGEHIFVVAGERLLLLDAHTGALIASTGK